MLNHIPIIMPSPMPSFEAHRRAFADIGPIIKRHVFILVNLIIFAVIGLLVVFGNSQSALFLGLMISFNMLLGIVQDVRARVALEQLQLLTALRVTRLTPDGSDVLILAETVQAHDQIRLRLGDQVPCDAIVRESHGLELSTALITGESDSFPYAVGDLIAAGAIVSAGHGVCELQTKYADSLVARMTAEAKRYSEKPSPIELSIREIVRYAGYTLLLIVAFIAVRGTLVGDPWVKIVLDVGALASVIIPQGLIVITTLFFAFGAAIYARKHVLFQEINVTEKLGRIKNICLDKTGTLTSNNLVVDAILPYDALPLAEIAHLARMYIKSSGDASRMLAALARHLGEAPITGEMIGNVPFSSWRQYGAIAVSIDGVDSVIFVGASEILRDHFVPEAAAWLPEHMDRETKQGKRVLCMARLPGTHEIPTELPPAALEPLALCVFRDDLREGIQDTIAFFQKLGIQIRIISGDNPQTVAAVARAAGVQGTERIVTGVEVATWDEAAFNAHARAYTIFARIKPEQKVRLIEAMKTDGFTAMVGDGANDALAIKTADLGIAMFDGVPATRRLAGVILTENSFTDLPGGVALADNFIRNIEVYAAIFLNQSAIALFFFAFISCFGYAFPLLPLNISLINYYAVGLPGMLIGYWAIRPSAPILPASAEPFLRRVLPFVFWSSLLQALAITVVFFLTPEAMRVAYSNGLVGLTFIVCGYVFFAVSPRVYRGVIARQERWHIAMLALIEVAIGVIMVHIPVVVLFFGIPTNYPPVLLVYEAAVVWVVYTAIQVLVTHFFFIKRTVQ